MTSATEGYRAVAETGGWIDRSDRLRLDVRGPDRAKMLHNLTTNDVKRLPVGRGCESFVTNPQGKALGYVSLHAAADRILLRSDPGTFDPLRAHLEKYGAFDEATWDDLTESTFEYHIVGPRALAWLDVPPEADLHHVDAEIGGRPVLVIRESPAGRPGLTLIGARADAREVALALHDWGESQGLVELDGPTWEALRIEAGTPVAGLDVKAENLPQEVGRDGRAINFVKGCYLGQETVARLDALGHVNKILRGGWVEGSDVVPEPGTGLLADGKRVGTVTSAARSPGRGKVVLLAYVRTTHADDGIRLELDLEGRPAVFVTRLPMPVEGA